MDNLLKKLNAVGQTNIFLLDLLSKKAFQKKVLEAISWKQDEDEYRYLDPDEWTANPYGLLDNMTQDEVYNELRKRAVDAISEQLYFSDMKLYDDLNNIDVVSRYEKPEMAIAIDRITIEEVRELLKRGQVDLNTGDYDSIVTKSRTILESVFCQILRDENVEYKHNGSLKKYRNEVNNILDMRIQRDWNPRIRDMVSSVNSLVDRISELRNNDSDAHAKGSVNSVRIDGAEAELLLNTAAALGIYYLRVSDRQKGKENNE